MSDIVLNEVGDVQKFVTNAPTVLTNLTGGSIRYRMTPHDERDIETLADDGVVTVPPGMVVEFFDEFREFVTAHEPAHYTDADFEDITAGINTLDKYTGKFVWDVTTAGPLWAGGPDAGDSWIDGTSSSLYVPIGVPEAFVADDWTLTDLSTAGDANIGILTLPFDSNDDLTDIEYCVDSDYENAVSLAAAIADDYPVAGFTDGVPTTVEIRAINASGEGPWSDIKTVTTTV
jgi:hypothetical protein